MKKVAILSDFYVAEEAYSLNIIIERCGPSHREFHVATR